VQLGVAPHVLEARHYRTHPDRGYTCDNMYSKKTMMWLLHLEETNGVEIKHARNGSEYRPPELPQFSVDSYCQESITVYEFYGCFCHGTADCRSET